MPRVKIDYVVSFSSEDPDHPAQNLLAWEVSKKKWLCKKGESSCSVVLQLTKAVKISSVHIGVHHAAMVEVLVARSEKGSEQYQVLVPSCVFVPPSESRRDVPAERVRSFSAEQLAAEARAQRWDRVRVVCSQPYNKHCKYGLSFIHIDSPDVTTAPALDPEPEPSAVPTPTAAPSAGPVPARLLALDTFSSDEEDFRPGELFAKHLQNTDSQGTKTSSDTGAQIRQATSQALKNISESSTKLMKTPISKPKDNSKRANVPTSEGRSDRSRDTLLYTDDDERPHAKIDQVVHRHNQHKQKDDKIKEKHDRKEKDRHKTSDDRRTPKRRKSDSGSETPQNKKIHKNEESTFSDKKHGDTTSSSRKNGDETSSNRKNYDVTSSDRKNSDVTSSDRKNRDVVSSDKKRTDDSRKRPRLSREENEDAIEESSEPHTILKDVVLVLSGYQNPQRAHVRSTALALGARVERDWGDSCTHLICAFPNTPKLRAVRAAGGGSVPVVLAEWVLQCSARRRRLPWQWFATEPRYRVAEPRAHTRTRAASQTPPRTDAIEHNDDTECDTDDEIEKVLQQQKARQLAVSPKLSIPRPVSPDTPEGGSTDEECAPPKVPRFGGALPDLLEGRTFLIDADGEQARTLARYVTAYGGLVLQPSQVDDDCGVEYVLSARPVGGGVSGGARVTPAWLARVLRAGELLPPD